ncbi:unnamed protein product [Gadus morhua 'NCC']
MIDRDGAPGEWRQVVQGDTNLIRTRRITAARATQDGIAVRELFKENFHTEPGRIDWQDRHVESSEKGGGLPTSVGGVGGGAEEDPGCELPTSAAAASSAASSSA